PFYLEYSNAPDDLVLNGFMLSLKGLAIYDSLIGDETSDRVLKEGVETLRKILPYYEKGNWSLYSPKHGEATEVYHRLHIRLLYFLGKWLSDREFLSYAERWDSYLPPLSKSELPRAEQEYEFWRTLVNSLRGSGE
ncbi:MAG: D-glucuronyl C5-epimerase family protein, partial [Candidatus Korarchaeum sp.]|nr:D-glucuronyl C5-epimerase family protein [Candidatus Korarchaeum sp.]